MAKEQVGPQWQRLEIATQNAVGITDGEQIRFTVPEINKTDAAGAVLRGDIRSHFISQPAAMRKVSLMTESNPIILAALHEGPAYLAGIDNETAIALKLKLMEHNSPGKYEEHEIIRAAVKVSNSLRAATQAPLINFTGKPKEAIEELLRLRTAA